MADVYSKTKLTRNTFAAAAKCRNINVYKWCNFT